MAGHGQKIAELRADFSSFQSDINTHRVSQEKTTTTLQSEVAANERLLRYCQSTITDLEGRVGRVEDQIGGNVLQNCVNLLN